MLTPMKRKALGDAAREEQPAVIAVAFDDEGQEVFRGAVLYADGGMLGIEHDGQVSDWPMELVQLTLAD